MLTNFIELAELGLKYYGYKDKKNKAIRKKLKELGVTIQTDRIRDYVFESEFLIASNKINPQKKSALTKGLVLNKPKKTNQMENVTLKEKDQEIGLFITCKCKKPYKHEANVTCSCKKFRYVTRIPVPGQKPLKRSLQAKNILDAKIELNALKKQIETGTYVKEEKVVQKVQQPLMMTLYGNGYSQQQYQVQSPTLLEAIQAYLNYLDKKGRSKENNQEAERYCYMLVYVLEKMGYDTSKMLFTDIINNDVTENFCDLLNTKTTWIFKGKPIEKAAYQPPTFNTAVGRMSSFSNYIIGAKNLFGFPNIWNKYKVGRIDYATNPEQFPPSKFETLISCVCEENGWTVATEKTKRRNLYYPFLKDSWLFGLITGGRRDVVAYATFKCVEFEDGIPNTLKVPKYKENRQKDLVKYDEQYHHFWHVKIDTQILDFLTRRGLFDKIGSDEYIIAPEEPSREHVLKHCGLTNAFSHFSKIATGRKYEFRQLRKTNFTKKVNDYVNGLIKVLNVEHKNIKTTKKYYLDKRA